MLSDPHLAKRLLDSMNVKRDSKKKFQLHKTTTATTVAASPSSLSATSSLVDSSDLPATLFTTEQDRTALLEWAYFEAVTLVRQNGDVLERVRQYMAARTSSVGETALMIDDLMC